MANAGTAGRTVPHASLLPHPPVRRDIAAVATFALVACGGDDDDTSATTETATRHGRRRRHERDTGTSDTTETSVDGTPPRPRAVRSAPARTTSRRRRQGFPVDDDELGDCIAEALISDDVFAQIEELGVTPQQFEDESPEGVGITLDEDQATAMAEDVAACGVLPADVLEDEAELACATENMSDEEFAQYVTFTLFSVAPSEDLQAAYDAMEECMSGATTTTS